MSKIRIFWSGYLDFPDKLYSGGTKDGDNISGEFDSSDIVLDRMGSVSYSIDEGEPTFPKSSRFSFVLKNKNQFGVEKYSENFIRTFGRTKEYGGTKNVFGDIFIRVDFEQINKTVYLGAMDSFSFTKRNEEVKIDCVDVVGWMKGSDIKMFFPFNFESLELGRASFKGKIDNNDNKNEDLINREDIKNVVGKNQEKLYRQKIINEGTDNTSIFQSLFNNTNGGIQDLDGDDLNLQVLSFNISESKNQYAKVRNKSGEVLKYDIDKNNFGHRILKNETLKQRWNREEQFILNLVEDVNLKSVFPDVEYVSFLDSIEDDIWKNFSSLRRSRNFGFGHNFSKVDATDLPNWQQNFPSGYTISTSFNLSVSSIFRLSTFIKETKWLTGFVQVGEFTLLTKYRIIAEIQFNVLSNVNEQTGERFHIISSENSKLSLQVVHSNNKFTKINVDGIDDEVALDLFPEADTDDNDDVAFLFERTRFYKGTESPKTDEIKKNDKLNVTLHEFDRTLDSEKIVFDGIFSSDKNSIDIKKENLFIHSVLFNKVGAGVFRDVGRFILQPALDGDSFDVITTLAKSINRFVSRKFALDNNVNIFNLSTIGGAENRKAFISDVAMYDWLDTNIEDAIVNSARQINCFIFLDESGKISYKKRNLYERFLPDNKMIPSFLSTTVDIEDFSIASGDSISVNADSYSIEFSDILEANNLSSEKTVSLTVDKSGIVQQTTSKTRDLAISNYRTSDLGIPNDRSNLDQVSSLDIKGKNNQKRFRFSIFSNDNINPNNFLNTPVRQAVNFIQSQKEFAKTFSINLDILKNPGAFDNILDESGNPILDEFSNEIQDVKTNSYSDIGVGSLVNIDYDALINYFIVTKINYEPSQIMSNIMQSFSLEMLFLGRFESLSIIRDQSWQPLKDQNNSNITTG